MVVMVVVEDASGENASGGVPVRTEVYRIRRLLGARTKKKQNM